MYGISCTVVSKSKDTSFLKAIHNLVAPGSPAKVVVSKSKDTSFLKAIHNTSSNNILNVVLFQRAKIQVF